MTARISYAERLRDPRWQRKRLEVMQRDRFTCQHCFDEDSPLHVHHRVYVRGRDPWDYPMEAFVTLCEGCHEEESQVSDAIAQFVLALRPQSFGNTDTDFFFTLATCGLAATAGRRTFDIRCDDLGSLLGGLLHVFLVEAETEAGAELLKQLREAFSRTEAAKLAAEARK